MKTPNLSQTIIIAIICITIIEVCALMSGINGQLLRFMIATIVGLVALIVPSPIKN